MFHTYSLKHSAARGGSAAAIEALLALHPDATGWVRDDGSTPLQDACCLGHVDAVHLLLRAAPHTATVADWSDQAPQHWAALAQDTSIPIVQALLLAAPSAAEITDACGLRPLDQARSCLFVCSVHLPVACNL